MEINVNHSSKYQGTDRRSATRRPHRTVADVAYGAIRAQFSNRACVAIVLSQIADAETTVACIRWYRCQLKRALSQGGVN